MSTSGKYHGSQEYHLVYCLLIQTARNQDTVTYQEIAEIMGLPLRGSHMSKETGRICGEISKEEGENGRPMLSAVVVSKSDGMPGEGFFVLAKKLGRLKDDTKQLLEFWENEKASVYAVWQNEPKHTGRQNI